MRITVEQGDVTQVSSPALIVSLFEGVTRPGGATDTVDRALGHGISEHGEGGYRRAGEDVGGVEHVTGGPDLAGGQGRRCRSGRR